MLERPNLADVLILACLQQQFNFTFTSLEFLPIGNDPTAWVYRVSTNSAAYFLKVKRGVITLASVHVPHYLHGSGIEQVLAPLPNRAGELWTTLNDFVLILYPYVDGQAGMNIGLSQQQWIELGSILKQIHATSFPLELVTKIPRESFIPNPKWTEIIQSLKPGLSQSTFKDTFERELTLFWNQHAEEITGIVNRAQELGRLLQAHSLPFVICHADFHTANVLVNADGHLFIVDWDGTIFAPKERDLLFVVEERSNGPAAEQAFLSGYGATDVDWLAVAYYRYEWVVQEIADYAERVSITPDVGIATKQDAVRGFKQLFDAGDVIDSARESEQWLT